MKYSRPFLNSSVPSWCPPFLHRRFLVLFALLCILIIVAIQLVTNPCSPSEYGCRVFGGEDPDHVSSQTRFVYNVLPTILAICFGLTWALAHHDFLRIEPWFQLSRADGATAGESLLLEYQYLFPPYALWVSVKKRHPHVFLSTLITLTIALVLTPLSSALFDEAPMTRTTLLPTTYTLPLFDTPGHISTAPTFAYAAYSHAWLKASLPSYTTPTFSISPWATNTSTPLSGTATLFESTLSCSPSTITPIKSAATTVAYNLTSPFSPNTFHTIFDSTPLSTNPALTEHLGAEFNEWMYDTTFSPNASWHFLHLDPDAPSADAKSQLFLFTGAWEKTNQTSLPKQWTAVWCTPSYWQQDVSATVSPDGEVTDVVRMGERVDISDTGLVKGFFYSVLLANFGIDEAERDSRGLAGRFGYVYSRLPSVERSLERRFGEGGVRVLNDARGLEGFALYGVGNETVGGMVDPRVVGERLEGAFKMLFACFVRYAYGRGSEAVEVVVEGNGVVRGFRVNERWARATQGVAGVLGVLVLVVVVISGRVCKLDGEPNSLAVGLGLLYRSEEMAGKLSNAEFHPIEGLRRILKRGGARYRLHLDDGVGPRVELLGGTDEKLEKGDMPYGGLASSRGWPVTVWSGVVFVSLFGAVLVALIAVFSYSQAHKGFSTQSLKGTFWQPFIFSYLPTLLGLSFEPLLVTLSNYYCMFGPYSALVRGQASSKRSLALDYDIAPAHFQLLHAWRVRDVSLAALTMAILATNVLAAALSGLFSGSSAPVQVHITGTTTSQPIITGSFRRKQEEGFYRLLASHIDNMTVPAPSWTTPTHYILPVTFTPPSTLLNASLPTLGLGATITCSVLAPGTVNIYCTATNDTRIPCIVNTSTFPSARAIDIDDPCWDLHPLRTYDEYEDADIMAGMVGMGVFARSQSCENTFFVLWAENPAVPNPGDKADEELYSNTWDSAVLRCSADAEIVKLSATVDRDWRVLASDGVLEPGQLDNGSELIDSFTASIAPIVMKQNVAGQSSLTVWMDYLLRTLHPEIVQQGANLTKIPDREVLPGAFEDLYRRLFAVSLSLDAGEMLGVSGSEEVMVTAILKDERMVVSVAMFAVAAAIVGYTVLLLLVLYYGGTGGSWRAVVHEPVSLAGMWAGLYASDVKRVCGELQARGPRERAEVLKRRQGRYSYGTFRGADGKTHVGVFSERVVEESEGLM